MKLKNLFLWSLCAPLCLVFANSQEELADSFYDTCIVDSADPMPADLALVIQDQEKLDALIDRIMDSGRCDIVSQLRALKEAGADFTSSRTKCRVIVGALKNACTFLEEIVNELFKAPQTYADYFSSTDAEPFALGLKNLKKNDIDPIIECAIQNQSIYFLKILNTLLPAMMVEDDDYILASLFSFKHKDYRKFSDECILNWFYLAISLGKVSFAEAIVDLFSEVMPLSVEFKKGFILNALLPKVDTEVWLNGNLVLRSAVNCEFLKKSNICEGLSIVDMNELFDLVLAYHKDNWDIDIDRVAFYKLLGWVAPYPDSAESAVVYLAIALDQNNRVFQANLKKVVEDGFLAQLSNAQVLNLLKRTLSGHCDKAAIFWRALEANGLIQKLDQHAWTSVFMAVPKLPEEQCALGGLLNPIAKKYPHLKRFLPGQKAKVNDEL
jgi:hypothetical protein